jgi:tetratricopeptide (TPR) repeat protein
MNTTPMRFAASIGLAALLLLQSIGLGFPAAAGTAAAAPPPDLIELVQMTAPQKHPGDESGAFNFEVTLRYHLSSAPGAFLVLFLLENDADISSQPPTSAAEVSGGDGRVSMEFDYQPSADARTVSVVAALFKDEQTMLTYVMTKPISLAGAPGRAEFDQALVAADNGDFDGAVRLLTRAVAIAPSVPHYYYWRADALIRLGEYDAAIADYNRTIELAPNDRASRVGRGVAHVWKGDAASAIADLSWAIERSRAGDRWKVGAHRARAVAFAVAGRPAEAIADYRAYLALVPNAPDRAQVEAWIAELS